MTPILEDIPAAVHEAFHAFISNTSQFTIPLEINSECLHALPVVSFRRDNNSTFQQNLSQLEAIISTTTPLYLIIRNNGSLTVVTYVPYLANDQLTQSYLSNRYAVIKGLGESNFSLSIICKEPGDITDARSWEERAEQAKSHCNDAGCADCEQQQSSVKDLGHKKTKCRLCDRRMKNKISEEAVEALKKLNNTGDCVQLSLDIPTETLVLNFQLPTITALNLPSKISPTTPSFTFYRHLSSALLYFIFFSPDSAPVKVRMAHTIAIPGLVSVIAKEQGVIVDQKIEIHDVEDLAFEEGDEKVGKFRSLYLLNERKGTESLWEGMERT